MGRDPKRQRQRDRESVGVEETWKDRERGGGRDPERQRRHQRVHTDTASESTSSLEHLSCEHSSSQIPSCFPPLTLCSTCVQLHWIKTYRQNSVLATVVCIGVCCGWPQGRRGGGRDEGERVGQSTLNVYYKTNSFSIRRSSESTGLFEITLAGCFLTKN